MLCSNQLSYVADVARIIRVRGFSVNPEVRIFSRAIKRLDVEAEVHDVAVLDDVFLAFQAPFAGFLGAGFALVLDEVVVGDHFGADEALFEVGVDHGRRLGGGGADAHGPGAGVLPPPRGGRLAGGGAGTRG